MRLPLALAVLAVLPAAPAAAQNCSAEAVSSPSLITRCGKPGDGAPCEKYINAVLDSCDKDLNAAADAMLKRRHAVPPPADDDAEALAARTRLFDILQLQSTLSQNVSEGANPRIDAADRTMPGLDLRRFEEKYILSSEELTQKLQAPQNIETPTGLDAPMPKDFKVDPPIAPPSNTATKTPPPTIQTEVAAKLEQRPPLSPAAEKKAKTQAAQLYLAGGDAKGAERIGTDLTKKDPKDPLGPTLLAKSALAGNKPQDAADWARKALELDPKNSEARKALGYAEALLSKSRLKGPGAKPGFDEKEAPETGGVAKVPAGGVPALGGVPGGAAGAPGATGPAIELTVPAHLRLAQRKAVVGDFEGALADLTLALDQNPDDSIARLLRAEVSNAMNNPAAGLADADRVLAKTPDDPRALRAKADALLRLGRLEEALAVIERALAVQPESPAGHLLRGQILEKLARAADSAAEYREAARLDPALTPVADAALKRLGFGPAADGPSPELKRKLVRGGTIVFSLLLVLAGLVGGVRVATRRARTAAAVPSGDPERTVGRGDTVAGQYTITRELGRGGMGVVFEALDERLKRPVALKQMQSDFRAAPEDAARFLEEARLVAQLKHPNVAEIYAAVDDGGLFLVFELIEGRVLADLLSEGPLSHGDARRVVGELCSALSAAHSRRIIHRDLKPSNVMLAGDGAVKIMDFGIAHQARGSAAATQTSASGTPPYMAPEQAMGSVLPASDLYALAVMTYELLCGTRPFLGPDFLGPKLRGEFIPITRQREGFPPALDAFFSAALSPDPDRRPKDAVAYRKALETCWDASMPRTVA